MTILMTRGKKTKLKMIQAAMDLFHAQGVRATSPQDVMDRTGTGKSQFYHYFGSKEGLVHETLQYFYAEMCEGRFNNQPIRQILHDGVGFPQAKFTVYQNRETAGDVELLDLRHLVLALEQIDFFHLYIGLEMGHGRQDPP